MADLIDIPCLTFRSIFCFDILMAIKDVPNRVVFPNIHAWENSKNLCLLLFMGVFPCIGACNKGILFDRPLHLSVMTWNVAVVKRWVELASMDEINEAIDIQSPVGTALCMAAASKKDHESGISWAVLIYGSHGFLNKVFLFNVCKFCFFLI